MTVQGHSPLHQELVHSQLQTHKTLSLKTKVGEEKGSEGRGGEKKQGRTEEGKANSSRLILGWVQERWGLTAEKGLAFRSQEMAWS